MLANAPATNLYQTNLDQFNQLTEGKIALQLDPAVFSEDKTNLDPRLQTSANFYNYGNGLLQLQGSAVVAAGTPSANMLISQLPLKFKPQANLTVPVAVLSVEGGYTANVLQILKEGAGIVGAKVLNGGSYTAVPDLTVEGDGVGAGLKALMGVLTVAITAIGTSYAVNDTITLGGGTSEAQLRVTSVNGTGGITGVVLVNQGQFTTLRTNPIAQSSTSGVGLGGQFTLTYAIIGVDPTAINEGRGYTYANIFVSAGIGSLAPVFGNVSPASVYLSNTPATGDTIYLDSPPFLVKYFT